MEHLLLQRSHRFPVTAEPQPVGWNYCRKTGVWVADPNGPIDATRPNNPTSKKADHETGEDMKGP